jgi:predicted RNA-binding protein (virulence factor B family)
VFLYRDSEDRLVATTEQPHVLVDQCACWKKTSCFLCANKPVRSR